MLTSDMNSTFHLSVWQEEHSVFDVEFTASGPAEVQMALENLHQLLNRFAPGEAKPTADLPAKPEPAVLVCWETAAPRRRDIGGWWTVFGIRTRHVTHWMPLPAPPGEEEPPHGAL